MSYTATQLISKAFNLFDESTDSKYEQSGNRTFALDMLNDGYQEVCRETHCYRTAAATIATVNGTREYALPDAFEKMEFMYCNNIKLVPKYYNNIELSTAGISQPLNYYLKPGFVGFDPLPNDAYTITYSYFGGPSADLTLDETPSLIPAKWQRILAYYVVTRLYQSAKDSVQIDPNARLFWKGIYEEQLFKMQAHFAGNGQYTEQPGLEC